MTIPITIKPNMNSIKKMNKLCIYVKDKRKSKQKNDLTIMNKV